MTERKLDYVILGLLSHEDMTGYEIKHRIDTALKYFWKASYGSIYPTLNSLVERGFAVKREDNETARTKQIYSVTLKGREYLREWLNVPVVIFNSMQYKNICVAICAIKVNINLICNKN